MLRKVLCEHPESVGETYGEHFFQAWRFGLKMILGGLACLVHGLIPSLFKKTGSATIVDLHDCMVASRAKQTPAAVLRQRRTGDLR